MHSLAEAGGGNLATAKLAAYTMMHLRLGFVGLTVRFSMATRMALSKTSLSPTCVRALHSMKSFAPTSAASTLPS